MKSFKDSEAREWHISINVATLKRVRGAFPNDEIDLAQLDPKLLQRLHAESILLVDVVYVLCRGQAEKRNVTDEQFGAAMAGTSIGAARQALLTELLDFFRGNQQHEVQILEALLDKANQIADAALTVALDGINKVDAQAMADKLAKSEPPPAEPSTSGSSSTAAPESAESTPALSHSAS